MTLPLHSHRVAMLVADGVEDLEYHVTSMRLQEAGATVLTAGLDLRPVAGKNGLTFRPDFTIDDLRVADLHGLILAGGWAPGKLHRYPSVIGPKNCRYLGAESAGGGVGRRI